MADRTEQHVEQRLEQLLADSREQQQRLRRALDAAVELLTERGSPGG